MNMDPAGSVKQKIDLVWPNYCRLEVLVRYIMVKEEQTRIVRACHTDPTSGHLGMSERVIHLEGCSEGLPGVGKQCWYD